MWVPHPDDREAESSLGLFSHFMLSSGVPSSPRSSLGFFILCWSLHTKLSRAGAAHCSQTQGRLPTASSKRRWRIYDSSPLSPDKPRGRNDSHSHCWMAASSDRHVMGHSHKRLGRRAVFLAPGVSSFPRKQISRSSVVFWQPAPRPAGENSEVPGQELAPGLSPARRAKSDLTARLRQLLGHGTATALPPHVCSKRTSFHGKMRLRTSQAATGLARGGFQIRDSKKPIKSQVWNGRQDECRWTFPGEVSGWLWRSGTRRAKMDQLNLLKLPRDLSLQAGQWGYLPHRGYRGRFERKRCWYTKDTRHETEDDRPLGCSSTVVLGKGHHFCRFGKSKEQSGASTWKDQVWQAAPSAPAPSRSVFIPGPEGESGFFVLCGTSSTSAGRVSTSRISFGCWSPI